MSRTGPLFQSLVKSTCVRVVSSDDSETHFRPHGSAWLFAIGGMYFLVTAAHLYDDGARLWVENNESLPRTEFPALGSRLVLPLHDVAVVRLRDEVVHALAGMRFLTMQEVALGPPEDSPYLLAGFPQELNTDHRVARSILYFTKRYTAATEGLSFNPKTQLLFEYDLSFSSGVDGTMSGMPDRLHGMSGSAIWHIDLRNRTPETSRVVGVQTSTARLQNPSNMVVVKATRWDGVLLSLVRIYPDLEPVLRLCNVDVAW